MSQLHPLQNQHPVLVTNVAKARKPVFSNPIYAREAIESLYRTQQRFPFFLYAFVIMPDHCHFLLNVPEYGSISKIMYSYKRAVIFKTNCGSIWQRGFHLRIIENLGNAIRYIHQNPVKAGLCEVEQQYPWSSACGKWDLTELSFI